MNCFGFLAILLLILLLMISYIGFVYRVLLLVIGFCSSGSSVATRFVFHFDLSFFFPCFFIQSMCYFFPELGIVCWNLYDCSLFASLTSCYELITWFIPCGLIFLDYVIVCLCFFYNCCPLL